MDNPEETKPLPKEKAELPEAPASASMKVKSPLGYEYIFTMRDESAKTLLFKMNAMEVHMNASGFTPVAQNTPRGGNLTSQAPKVTKQCTVHNEEMIQQLSKKGMPYFSHGKGVFPNRELCFGEGYDSEKKKQQVDPGEYPGGDFEF